MNTGDAPAGAQALLHASDLPSRWRGCASFVSLEAGFNAGLNFLAAWQAWRDDPERCAQLHYLVLEETFPAVPELVSQQAQDGRWPELSAELCAAWPVAMPGFHRLLLDGGRVVLTLAVGPIDKSLLQLDAAVDVFYLHGFAADATSRTLGRLARMALPQATLVSSAHTPELERAFAQLGFVSTGSQNIASPATPFVARFVPRWNVPSRHHAGPARKVIVIGAGLAGAAACERFAARGWQVDLIEAHAQPAQQASGNLAGIFMPVLSRDDNPASRLSRAAYLFALHYWKLLGGVGTSFPGACCGVLQLARDLDHARGQRALGTQAAMPEEFAQWLEADAVSARLGTPVAHGGWLFPQGGWATPGSVCRAMLAACAGKLTTHFEREVTQLRRVGETWQAFDQAGALIAEAPIVILANGTAARRLAQAAGLPLSAVRGQVTHVPAARLPALPHVVCGDGYVTPSMQGWCSVGASYDLQDDASLRQDSHDANLARLQGLLPDVAIEVSHIPLDGRVGFRCVAPDRMPLAGALPDAGVAGRRNESVRDVPRQAGLYGLLGYASRGLIWAPLAAELLVAQIEGEPSPIERDLVDALDPARFLFRNRAAK